MTAESDEGLEKLKRELADMKRQLEVLRPLIPLGHRRTRRGLAARLYRCWIHLVAKASTPD